METTPDYAFRVDVTDERGRAVAPTAYGRRVDAERGIAEAPARIVHLRAGEAKQYRLRLNRLRDLTLAGAYRAVITFESFDAPREVASNEFHFHVVDADPPAPGQIPGGSDKRERAEGKAAGRGP